MEKEVIKVKRCEVCNKLIRNPPYREIKDYNKNTKNSFYKHKTATVFLCKTSNCWKKYIKYIYHRLKNEEN